AGDEAAGRRRQDDLFRPHHRHRAAGIFRRGHPQRLREIRQARTRHRFQAAVRRAAAASWAFVLVLSTPVFAWGPEGHRVVGDIAERYLNERARVQITELLKNDRQADGQPSGRRTLGEISSWADEIKDFDWGRRRASWHYDDMPLRSEEHTS